MRTLIQTLFFVLTFSALGCEGRDEPIAPELENTLEVSMQKIEFLPEGGTTTITIETDAPSWLVENPATDWINIPVTSGESDNTQLNISVETRSLTPRSDTLTFKAGNAQPATVIISQASSDYWNQLTSDKVRLYFDVEQGKTTLSIMCEAPEWKLTCEADWVEMSSYLGTKGTSTLGVSVAANETVFERSTTIDIGGEGAAPLKIVVVQQGNDLYPSYNTNPLAPDITGMNSSAQEIAEKIKIGWNIGNTLEAIGGETAWGNPMVTEELIQLVKQKGFNAIRIPCSWNQYMENSSLAEIKTSWLDRVKQVVQYCVDNDMYVVLNIHWDGGWLENNCTPEKQPENNAKQKAFWEQIATHLRDFDEHLLFAGANEPNVENATQMNVLQSYHQTFVNAVRSTGGKNSYRVLVVQGPSTDIEKTNSLMSALPTDQVEGRMMAEIHYYTPYQFCLMNQDASWGKMFYYWGSGYHSTTDTGRNANWGEESTLDDLMGRMKTQFVDKGIPVILGEFAAIRRSSLTGDNLDLHLASRAYFLKYLTKKARANGILPFYWDAGNMGNNASALFNRQNLTVYDQQALDALMEGINE